MEVANRFGVGTATKVIKHVENAVEEWPVLANESGVDPSEIKRIRADHENAKLD